MRRCSRFSLEKPCTKLTLILVLDRHAKPEIPSIVMYNNFMRRLLLNTAIFSFLFLNLTWLYSKNVICECSSFILSCDCQPGEIAYTTYGFPLEFFWSNQTGFILSWYLIDYLFFFVATFFLTLLSKFLSKRIQMPSFRKSKKVFQLPKY